MSGRNKRSNVGRSFGHGIVCRKCLVDLVGASGVATVNVGTLVEIHKEVRDDVFFYALNNRMQAEKNSLYRCKRGDILLVPENLCGPLLAVEVEERLPLVRDTDLAERLGNIEVGNAVKVLGKDRKEACTASVTFKNSIEKLGLGIYFGLRITHPKKDITRIVENLTLLTPGTKGFPRGCDIVVSVDKLRLTKSAKGNSGRPSSGPEQQPEPAAESNKKKQSFDGLLVEPIAGVRDNNKNSIETSQRASVGELSRHDSPDNKEEEEIPELPLSIGEEVVFLDDGEPEIGTVRWLGLKGKEPQAGVEFQNPIGTGTGTLNGHRLFKTKLGSASFIPIAALIKLSDFLMDTSKNYANQQKSNNNIPNNLSFNHDVINNHCYGGRHNLDETMKMPKMNAFGHDLQYPSSSLRIGETSPTKNCNEDLGYNGMCATEYVNCFSQSHSRSFDSVKPSEKKISNNRQSKSIDNDLSQSRDSLINLQKTYSPSKDLEDIFSHNRLDQCDLSCDSDFTCGTSDYSSSLCVETSDCSYTFGKKNATNNALGQFGFPVVEGTVPPIKEDGNLEKICGKNRGIQGHNNSCYLDATLFAMFAFTSVFDSLLYRPPTVSDIPEYSEVQRVLKEEIVNPLRKNLYVGADEVMKLRTLLERLSSVSGLTCDEKDPEEFLNSLLAQILKAEPFLKLSSGHEAFHYQLFVEKDERLTCPSVQELFEQSFFASDIKLKEVPSCLIIQMPRFGKSFKMYSKIIPPQSLDVTDIIENSPRGCTVCWKLAKFECRDCFGQDGMGSGLQCVAFCKDCCDKAHVHHRRIKHKYRPITMPSEFSHYQACTSIQRIQMELFAVVCIETSHYVAFVKCGTTPDAPWCFFDSMADREGEQNGYNIPEMVPCPDLPFWLSEEGARVLNTKDERQLPEHAKRLLCDAYMCMYQSPEIMMYR